MRWVSIDDVRGGEGGSRQLGELLASIGTRTVDPDWATGGLGLPLHLAVTADRLAQRRLLTPTAFDAIPFYSLCRGLLMPLSGMAPERAAQLFGVRVPAPPSTAEREELVGHFLERDLGLTLVQKVACLLGDPFEGEKSSFRRESLLRLLASVRMVSRRELLDRLAITGDVAILFAESRRDLRGDPPLTAAEVLHTLRLLPALGRNQQFQVLRSLLERCGRVEAYFVTKLILGRAGLRYESELLARCLAERWGAEPEQISHAMALTDPFRVVRLLDEEGLEGLRQIELQPLVAVRPALASNAPLENLRRYPVWVERKYDGIRLMLHKATDAMGSVLVGAYSRNRKDYLEMIHGLDATVRRLPAASAIVDGELCGTVMGLDGARPATVYEVFAAFQGDGRQPVALRYAAFDLLYLNGEDLTPRPLSERRQRLQMLLTPLLGTQQPVPLALAEGQLASSVDDIRRLYQHFRAQGHEGVITKDLEAPYRLAARDPSWLKKKPEVTLDLVLLGAVLAVTTKEKAGMFGSYVIGAKTIDGAFEDVGDVAGVDQVRDAEVQRLIMSEGLLTGQRIERQGMSGARPGFELVPHIVVTVRFSGVVRDPSTGRLSLRDPKLAVIRGDKSAGEADTIKAIEDLYLKEKVG